MAKSKKKTKGPTRCVSCDRCGYNEMVEYDSTIWFLTAATCSKCLAIEANFPELYQWIVRVIEKNRLSEYQVEDIVDKAISRQNSNGYY